MMNTQIFDLSSGPLAVGRTAEVYPWGEGKILKLYLPGWDPRTVRYEARMARAVQASGLPVPAAYDVVEINGRAGLVYDRLDGEDMIAVLYRQPERVELLARRQAELHAQIHDRVASLEIPPQRQRLIEKIHQAEVLPAELRPRILKALAELPDGDRLCHGDFHAGNILITPGGETVIDWIDVTRGNPLADVARSVIIMRGAVEAGLVSDPQAQAVVLSFCDIYLREYFRLRPGGEEEYQRWLPLVAAGRLSENITVLQGWLIEMAKAA